RPLTAARDHPAYGERLRAVRTDFDGDLVGRTADAAAADLDARLHIVERIVEHTERVLLQALLDIIERGVDDAFGDRLLAVEHDRIHELRQDDIPELGIGKNDALFWAATTGH